MKRICSIFLAFALTLGAVPAAFAAYTDVEESSEIYDAVSLLSDMNIISGYTDGTFKPSKTLTRAEFAKLIVMIYDKQTEAQYNSVSSNFKDVLQGSWYVGYVNYISQKQIINGYSDGTFGPDKNITYAEAVTILCRILGYNEDTVGYFWPNNYLSQAEALKLNEGLYFGANDPITRGAAAVLIERLLFTNVPNSSTINSNYSTSSTTTVKTNDGTVGTQTTSVKSSDSISSGLASNKSIKFIEYLGYTLLEDSYVLATRAETESLTSKQIRTASGVYEIADGVALPQAGMAGTIVINKDGKIAGMKKEAMEKMTVYVTNIPEANTIEYRTQDGQSGKYKFDTSFETYVNYNKLTYSQGASYVGIDTEITFYGEDYGEWKFAVIDDEVSGSIPVLASRNYSESDNYIEDMLINKTNLEIYRNGEAASLSDIKKNDVVYYNTKTNVITVYNNKVSGIYTEAYPDKANVTSVKVAGKTYELSSSGAAKKNLDASGGSFAIGEKVTLLLGKNDKVEFAVELTDFDYFDYGVLLSCEKGISEDEYNEGVSQITAKIFMPDGNTYTYAVDKDYSDTFKGDLVKLTYSGDKVSLSAADSTQITGSLDIQGRKFAGKTVLKDVKVIQRLSKEDADVVSVELLNFDTLGITEINSNQVIDIVAANAFGDIGIMYLENLESSYQFGYLAGAQSIGKDEMSTYQYKIFSDGITTTYPDSVRYVVTARTPVYFKTNGSSVTEIYSMKKIAQADEYDAIEGGRIKIKGEVYNLADDMQIVYVEDSLMAKFQTVSISEMEKMDFDSVTLYAQKDNGTDSDIKVIVIE